MRLGASSVLKPAIPVRFMDGCAIDATKPAATGSPTLVKTMGSFWVASRAALAACSPTTTMTSTRAATSS
jgi:hypothetical protein